MSAINTVGSNGDISPMELESLANGDDSYSKTSPRSKSRNPIGSLQQFQMLVRLYFELYPRFMMAVTGSFLTVLLMWWSPWSGRGMSRNSMTHDYTTLQNNFNFQKAQIDHWCLFGGDDKCFCEDPMEPMGREEMKQWVTAHQQNKLKVAETLQGPKGVDVVFIGDQTVQSWDGRWYDRTAPEGLKIKNYFNATFGSKDSQFVGLPLGIYGDRINNILWRIQHGEVPLELKPKVFWLIMGTNDLAVGMCSEEVVTLGIMRVAEELHHHYPDSVIVIQGILPRSNHRDGSLEGKKVPKYAQRGVDRYKRKRTGGSPSIGSAHKKERDDDPSFNPNGVRRTRQLLQDDTGNHHHHHHHVLATKSRYNPMDEFFDNYLDHYDDVNATQQLLEEFWGPHVEGLDFLEEKDNDSSNEQQEAMWRKLEDGDDDDDAAAAETTTTAPPATTDSPAAVQGPVAETTTTTTEAPATTFAPVKTTFTPYTQAPVKTTFTAVAEEAGTQATSGGSIMTSPQQPYKYEDVGKITPNDNKNKARLPHFDFYLWPSIKAINKELEGFCEKHEHFVYFDADDLILGSLGNKHYKEAHKTIIKDLMPNYVHLSFEGHIIVLDAIKRELKRIIVDDDERNDIETVDPDRKLRDETS